VQLNEDVNDFGRLQDIDHDSALEKFSIVKNVNKRKFSEISNNDKDEDHVKCQECED